MGPLDQLRAELGRINTGLERKSFGSSKSMEKLAVEVERRFGIGIAPGKDLIAGAIREFHSSGQIETFRDLKLVCYGVATELFPDRFRLSHDPERIDELLRIVRGIRSQHRQYRRCYQALMTTYFEWKPEPSHEGPHLSWLAIRQLLREGIPSARHDEMPEWARAVIEHRNVFDEDPCEPYGKEILAGNVTRIRELFTTIGIARNSWLQVEVLIAAIQVACKLDDQYFRRHIEVLLNLLRENPAIQVLGVKYVLDRYARLDSHREHTALRVFAINLLGNPLLLSNAPRWVRISPEARKMVSDWIKLKLIEQFFELLSHDGATDSRRLQFWSEYVSLIENVWFVLGSGARGNLSPDFKKLRHLMGDQALNLEGATYGNNAFVMKIGKLIVVEFGETGNAAYLFDSRNLPFSLEGTLNLRNDLKNRRNLGNLKHVDGREKWPIRFRQAIREHTGIMGCAWGEGESTEGSTLNGWAQKATMHEVPDFERIFKAFCANRGLRVLDQRHTHGKLIVYADADNPKVSGTLGQWGFKFDRSTCTWMKDS